MSAVRLALPVLLAVTVSAHAQTALPTPTVAPRTPGDTGALHQNQGRMNQTVGSISNHLLKAEKHRPRLPNQAPSVSQTLPGGTAAGQTPNDQAPHRP